MSLTRTNLGPCAMAAMRLLDRAVEGLPVSPAVVTWALQVTGDLGRMDSCGLRGMRGFDLRGPRKRGAARKRSAS